MLRVILVYYICGLCLLSPQGQRQPRIISPGGETRVRNLTKYNFLVSVRSSYSVITREQCRTEFHVCSGVILDIHGTVLTHSACVYKERSEEKTLGYPIFNILKHVTVTWGSADRGYKSEIVLADRIFFHPLSYDRHNSSDKIDVPVALIYLETYEASDDVINCWDWNQTVRPIRLEPDLKAEKRTPIPSDGIVVSFGSGYCIDPPPNTNESELFKVYRKANALEMFYMFPTVSNRFETKRVFSLPITGFQARPKWSWGGEQEKKLCVEDLGAPFIYPVETRSRMPSDGFRLLGMVSKTRCLYEVTRGMMNSVASEILDIRYGIGWIRRKVAQRYRGIPNFMRGDDSKDPYACRDV